MKNNKMKIFLSQLSIGIAIITLTWSLLQFANKSDTFVDGMFAITI